MTAFDQAFTELVGIEGDYSNDERDPGNWTGGAVNVGQLKGTMYGISAAAYPNLDIAGLSLFTAKNLYRQDYWDRLRCDTLPDAIAIALFKEGVNMGVDHAGKVFQRSLGTTPDGNIGQLTVGFATSHPPKEVLENFLSQCASEYIAMKNFPIDGRGWMRRLIITAVEAQT